ncbi:CbtB domain-containing protein [Candidatus Frankia nodulisporulans]|uniref:CbtB domain-containing protein n=1 Tax=Candidatus Frankia nodulisporulans TaxID=2060052 RepID=UPI0013D16A5F|nr:CbtB-domain containing protein [Candidatus Frankia nodulisporulans]
MTTPVAEPRQHSVTLPLTACRVALGLTALLSLALLYFIGVDQGATSLFGSDTHIHEFVHDARHFIGFPCH